MRAAYMHEVEVVKVEDAPEPGLDPAGGLLRVEACGICGTDARTYFNGDPRAPSPWILGHEPVGTLVEVGPDAELPDGIARGQRVFLGSILTCGTCRSCLDGYQNLCERHELYGYDPHPGAFSDVAAVPPIGTKNLIAVPPEMPPYLATVVDPFACALNGVEVADPDYGDTVVILGAGPIGCMQAVLCRDRGVSRVLLLDVSKGRLERALEVVGAFVDDAMVPDDADNGVAQVRGATGGEGAQRVIVAAPSKQAQRAALEMAGRRARVVYFAGLPKSDPITPFDANQLHYKELAVLGSYGATHRQYRITMDYLNRRRAELEGLVTHRLPLDRIEEGFGAIRSGAGLKIVIEP
jgi:L-iditol 2-dehydrogenase